MTFLVGIGYECLALTASFLSTPHPTITYRPLPQGERLETKLLSDVYKLVHKKKRLLIAATGTSSQKLG